MKKLMVQALIIYVTIAVWVLPVLAGEGGGT